MPHPFAFFLAKGWDATNLKERNHAVKVLVSRVKSSFYKNAVILSRVGRVFCAQRSRKPALSVAEGDLWFGFSNCDKFQTHHPRFRKALAISFQRHSLQSAGGPPFARSPTPATNLDPGCLHSSQLRTALLRQLSEYFPLPMSWAACRMLSGRPRSRQEHSSARKATIFSPWAARCI